MNFVCKLAKAISSYSAGMIHNRNEGNNNENIKILNKIRNFVELDISNNFVA